MAPQIIEKIEKKGIGISGVIRDRMDWHIKLWEETLAKSKDPEIAKIIFRRLVFEEGR